MKKITLEEFDTTHCAKGISEEEFSLLSQRALDMTEELCFGRAAQKEDAARRAMKEMIHYWIMRAEDEKGTVERMSVGNFSITRSQASDLHLHGVPLSPTALLILQQAGLRNCNL